MKTLLKLCVVAVVLVLGVSSCIKEDDSIPFRFYTPYAIQTDSGQFIPQMRLQSIELKSASLNVDGENFNFKSLTSPSYTWELPSSLSGLDSISSKSIVTLIGIDGKVETHQVGFYPTTKEIGDIDVDSLVYNPTTEKISIKLNSKVVNADMCYLMIKSTITEDSYDGYAMWMPSFAFSFEEDELSKTISYAGLNEGTYQFAIGAGYGSFSASVIKIHKKIITIVIEE